MAVQVKIPTILRTYTGGEKSVPGDGANLAALLDDLETRHAGLKGRLITEDGALHRFVNVYVNDEDVRFTGSLDTALSDGDAVTILPAVAGGSPESSAGGAGSARRRIDARADDPLRLAARGGRRHPAGRPAPAVAALDRHRRRARGPAVGQAGGPQPDRLDQGPGGAGDDRGRRGGRPADARAARSWSRPRATPASRWP